MLFASTSEGVVDGNLIPSPLIHLDVEMFRFVPICWSPHCKVKQWLPFDAWWGEDVFIDWGPTKEIGSGNRLTRGELIYFVRSQDKGAHFDGEWRNETYQAMAQGFEAGIHITHQDRPKVPLKGANEAAVRQIGWELVTSFSSQP
jgi:hypothetical protein